MAENGGQVLHRLWFLENDLRAAAWGGRNEGKLRADSAARTSEQEQEGGLAGVGAMAEAESCVQQAGGFPLAFEWQDLARIPQAGTEEEGVLLGC